MWKALAVPQIVSTLEHLHLYTRPIEPQITWYIYFWLSICIQPKKLTLVIVTNYIDVSVYS